MASLRYAPSMTASVFALRCRALRRILENAKTLPAGPTARQEGGESHNTSCERKEDGHQRCEKKEGDTAPGSGRTAANLLTRDDSFAPRCGGKDHRPAELAGQSGPV
jgi:hypothetical protein